MIREKMFESNEIQFNQIQFENKNECFLSQFCHKKNRDQLKLKQLKSIQVKKMK